MSRKKSQPKKEIVPDPKFNSTIIPKLINNLMYDGKRGIAAKIVYDAIEKIKTKSKDEPINVFNEAINNIKPTVEVRSRRVGGATYQVPVEVKSKRSQALALRWLIDASRKRKLPKKIPIVDPRYKSAVIPKLINSIMYDGKKTIAEKKGNY